MKHMRELAKRIAPLTPEQYNRKKESSLREAYDLVNSVTCRGRKVILKGIRSIGGNDFEDVIKFSNWDVRTQRLTIAHGWTTNQIPRSVAQDMIYAYLMSDYEADCCFI